MSLSSDAKPVNSAEKMLSILECFTSTDRALSVGEIALRTEMPRSTAHRWIASLRDIGLLEQESARDTYRLGLKLFQLGNVMLSSTNLHKEARPIVESLSEAAGEPVHLCVFDGENMIFVSQAAGGRAGRNNSTTVIEASPCHCSSVGKAALAFQPDAVIERILSRPLQAYTRNTITAPAVLREVLQRVREQGYAVNHGEMEEHERCVGAPVRNATGRVIAGLSVSTTLRRMPETRIPEIAELVIKHADALSIQLGYRQRTAAG